MAGSHEDSRRDDQAEQDAFSRLWDLGKVDPAACRLEIRARRDQLRAEGRELSIQLLGLHGLTLVSEFAAVENLIERIPKLADQDRTQLADLCEEGLEFILAQWHTSAANPEFWNEKIIDEQLGRFAVLLTELRPGRAERMLGERIAELPEDLLEMLDAGITDDVEWVYRIVSRHASQAPATGAAAQLQSAFPAMLRIFDAVTNKKLAASESRELLTLSDDVLGSIDRAMALEPQGVFNIPPFVAFHAFANMYKGSLLCQLGQSEEGLAQMRQTEAALPRSFTVRNLLANCLVDLGRRGEVEQQMSEMRQLASTPDQKAELALLQRRLSGEKERKGCWGG